MTLPNFSEARLEDFSVEHTFPKSPWEQTLLCVHTATGLTCVLSKISKSPGNDASAMNVREAWLTKVINMKAIFSPHVVKCFGSFEDNLYTYVVREPCEVENLGKLFTQRYSDHRPFSTDEIWAYSGELIAGLCDIHRLHIIHGDIRMDNIFVVEENHLKIGELGLSNQTGLSFTLLPSQIGIQPLMSPETSAGQPYTAKTDIFALGSVICELATAVPPAPLNIVPSLVPSVGSSPEGIARWQSLPQGLREMILRMLAQDPTSRPTAADLFELDEIQPGVAAAEAAAARQERKLSLMLEEKASLTRVQAAREQQAREQERERADRPGQELHRPLLPSDDDVLPSYDDEDGPPPYGCPQCCWCLCSCCRAYCSIIGFFMLYFLIALALILIAGGSSGGSSSGGIGSSSGSSRRRRRPNGTYESNDCEECMAPPREVNCIDMRKSTPYRCCFCIWDRCCRTLILLLITTVIIGFSIGIGLIFRGP